MLTRNEIQEIARAMSMTVGQILMECQEGSGQLKGDEVRLLQNLGTAAVELDVELQLAGGPETAAAPRAPVSSTLVQ
jgi:hypothetical protein